LQQSRWARRLTPLQVLHYGNRVTHTAGPRWSAGPGRRLVPGGTMTRVARVTGPVTGGARGWAFGRTLLPLDRYGYVDAEHVLDGEASRYGIAAGTAVGRDGRWTVEPRDTSAYRTRFIVMRPADPAAFNGTVVLSWNNVSAGFDSCTGVDSVEIV